MKKLIFFIFVSLFFVGCEKEPEPEPMGSGGIYINGVLEKGLKSSFAGGYSRPYESEGTIYVRRETFLNLYEKSYESYPTLLVDVRPNVQIHCTEEYSEKTYASSEETVDKIQIFDMPSIGDLFIRMIQGEYDGTNELVSSVSLNEYVRDNKEKGYACRVSIDIVLKDGRKISISYNGKWKPDGMLR